MKTAFLFSGQGAQYEGMGQDFAANNEAARAFYTEASRILGYDLLNLSEEELADTKYQQTATVALSLAIWQLIHFSEDYVLSGFSLGAYSAFAAAGLLSPQDTLRLVSKRAELMASAAAQTPGSMYAVMGLDDHVIENHLMENYPDTVWPVNYNAPGQLVIAGYEEPTAQAANSLAELGARRVVKLGVSGAFHTPLMQKAAEGIETHAKSTPHAENLPPNTIIYSNSSGEILDNSILLEKFPEYLYEHMLSPVKWTQTIENMYESGIRRFIELGPGKTLSGLVKRILKGKDSIEIINVSTWEDWLKFTNQ